MLDQETKKRIFDARDILVGKIPDPKAQVEQITTALIYKFMDDMDHESEDLGGEPQFFTGEYKKYAWSNVVDTRLGGEERFNLYVEALNSMPQNSSLPLLFRNMLKNAFLPYRDPETLRLFLKKINEFTYDHSEKLGDAFEYLLSVLGSQGDAGQFRTPRHIIDFIVDVLEPQKGETILDPACGTGGFLISSYKHILRQNMLRVPGDQLTPDEKTKLMNNFIGYDISPDMVRLCLVNMYLHNFPNPVTYEYDTLTSEERWDETGDLIMANPPFMSPTGGIRPHKRFSVQAKRSEILFVDYIAEHLNVNGRAGIIVPEGIIFQSGTSYKALRKMLVEKYLYAVVSLPAGIFNPYSGVKTSILLMDKSLTKMIKTILFVKIENDGFDLGAQRKPIDKNDLPHAAHILKYYRQGLLRGENIHTISDDVLKKASKIIMVEKAVLAKKGDYSLSGDRYKVVVKSNKQKFALIEVKDAFEKVSSIINPSAHEGKINFVGLENIVSHTGELTGNIVANLSEIKSAKSEFQENDILYGRLRPNLNKVWLANIKGICSTDIMVFRAKSRNILSRFYIHLLRSSHFNNEVLKGLNGAQLPRVGFDYLGDLKIPLLPLEAQQELVEEFDGYLKVIEGAKQVIANYKPTFRIDPAWEVKTLQDVCDRITDGTHQTPTYAEAGTIFLSSKNVITKKIDWEDVKYIPDELHQELSKRLSPKRDDILLAKNGTTGVAAIVDRDITFDIYVSLALLRPSDKVLPTYLLHCINSDSVKKQFDSKLKGVGVPNLHLNEIKEVQIPLPPLEVQEKIVSQIEEEQKLVEANNKLIEIFEQKIKDKMSEVWGYGDASIEAEPEIENNYVAASEEVEVVVPQIEQAALFTSF